MDEVPEILLCEVSNEVEAAMVVNLLIENEIAAHSDASQAGVAFGGLPFEPGHKVYVAASLGKKSSRNPGKLSPFQEAPQRPRTRYLRRRNSGIHGSRRGKAIARLLRRELFPSVSKAGPSGRPGPGVGPRSARARGSRRHAGRSRISRSSTKSIAEYSSIAGSRPISGGPLFAVSFVAGSLPRTTETGSEFDVIHTHQALWEAVATGLSRPLLSGKPTLVQPASAGYYGEAEELGRTRGAGALQRERSWPIPLSRRSPPRSSASGDCSGVAPGG